MAVLTNPPVLDDRRHAGSKLPLEGSLDAQHPAMKTLAALAEFLGIPLACVNLRTGKTLARGADDSPLMLPESVWQKLQDSSEPRLFELPSGLICFALSLPPANGTPLSACGYCRSRPGTPPSELVLAAAEEGWDQARFDRWLAEIPECRPAMLERLLRAAVTVVDRANQESAKQREIEGLASQLEYTYEEISLLHALTHNLQISRAPHELAELALQRVHGLIRAEGHAIWLQNGDRQPHFLVQGRIPFDEFGLARLIARFEQHDWTRPLVRNRITGTLLGADLPGLHSIVVVSITEGLHRSGWLCSCNLTHDREFGSVEARLLESVASILGTHGRNIELYRQHDELLLSFVRSLVSSLDAKDPYTRGHSERVALIARRIGQELRLPEDDLRDIYLSGLLHDIGKIGVDDQILRKTGDLTPEEFDQIRRHPLIGYNILAGLRNLQRVIPGVRHHHETYIGGGYPDGLAGEQIPLMARIIAVADSYDAMGSDRPYRHGMELEVLEAIFQRGSGRQWDAAVVAAYFSARDDIRRICETYSPGTGNLLRDADESESG